MPSSPATTDPKQACLEFFASLCPLSDTTQDYLNQKLVVHDLAKNTLLLSGDKVVDSLYYIEKGLLRNYFATEGGREITGWFADEGETLYFPSSHRLRIPLSGSVQLHEKSVLVSLTYEELNTLYELDPAANALGRRLSENQLQYLLKREKIFRARDSQERYLLFLELFPELEGRVQNQHVASYLEISPSTISRVLGGKHKEQNDSSPGK